MRRLVLAGLLTALFAGCGGEGRLDTATATIETAAGPVRVAVEVADSADERRTGLMGRDSLAEQAGMLFVYREDSSGGFWMKDTVIPLSIAFMDASGRILRVLDMEPCEADPCPIYDPGLGYRSALELNRGAFGRLGIDVGDVVELDSGG